MEVETKTISSLVSFSRFSGPLISLYWRAIRSGSIEIVPLGASGILMVEGCALLAAWSTRVLRCWASSAVLICASLSTRWRSLRVASVPCACTGSIEARAMQSAIPIESTVFMGIPQKAPWQQSRLR